MDITDSRIDAGKAFDWGRTSKDYAKYRDRHFSGALLQKKLWTGDFALKGSGFWILELV